MPNTITLDSSDCKTHLCDLCVHFGTDKSPFTSNGGHRHPYTTPYSLLLEPLKHKPIKMAEFGIFRGASILVWRHFFSRARIYGFDCDAKNMEGIKSLNIPGTYFDTVWCNKRDELEECFKKYTNNGELFDVIIDDASHDPGDQAIMIETAMPFLKQGGLLIIEDIFRDAPMEGFEVALNKVKDLISFHTFILCDHKDRWSPGWNNDKMLVCVRI